MLATVAMVPIAIAPGGRRGGGAISPSPGTTDAGGASSAVALIGHGEIFWAVAYAAAIGEAVARRWGGRHILCHGNDTLDRRSRDPIQPPVW